MKQLKLLLVLILSIKYVSVKGTTSKCVHNPLTVTLPQGRLKGSYDFAKSQIKFLGIPYASIKEKFQAPGKPPSWNGTFNADRGSIKCKQYHEQWRTIIGQEDCLVLNVFTPTYQNKEPFPVIVFIHGGAFYWGSNTELLYNTKYIVKEKVIVVTINYRLGALGFLCLPLKDAPGNAGLRDQIAALKWIQNNIAHFGGNPNSVTLFGQSAGGASINILMFSHSAKGLFHRAIIHSGTFISPHTFSYSPIEVASKVALRLGYNTSEPEELLKIYKNTAVDSIIKASTGDTTNNAFASYTFRPCVETAITDQRPLIAENPTKLLKKNGLNITAILGFNNKEGIYWASSYVPITLDKIKENFNDLIPANLRLENAADKNAVINDIVSVYFSNGSATDNLIDYFTDSLIRYPTETVSEALRTKPNRTIYNYYYTYDSIRNINKLTSRLPSVPGADHADELFCLFEPVLFNLIPPNSKDRAMIRTMVKLWTSFAKNGAPRDSKITWNPSDEQPNFIELGEEIKMTSLPNEDRMKFWRKLYDKYGKK